MISYDLLKLAKDFGETLTLRKKTTSGSYNPATGSVDGAATTDYSFVGYFYNYDNGIAGNLDEIRRGTRKCVIPALGLAVNLMMKTKSLGMGTLLISFQL